MSSATLQCVTPRLYLALRGHRLEEEFWRRVQTDPELAAIVGSPHTWTYPQMVSTLLIYCGQPRDFNFPVSLGYVLQFYTCYDGPGPRSPLRGGGGGSDRRTLL